MSILSRDSDRPSEDNKISSEDLARWVAAHTEWLAADGRTGSRLDKPSAELKSAFDKSARLRVAPNLQIVGIDAVNSMPVLT